MKRTLIRWDKKMQPVRICAAYTMCLFWFMVTAVFTLVGSGWLIAAPGILACICYLVATKHKTSPQYYTEDWKEEDQ